MMFIACANDQKVNNVIKEETSKTESKEESLNDIQISSLNFNELEPYLSTKNDSIYVINFWATWCKPCVKELPAFEKLGITYASDKVKVILVSLDFPNKKESQLIPFVSKKNLQSEVLLLDDSNANYWIPKVDESWTGAIPATIIFSKDKRKFYEQSFTYKGLENELKTIIN